jgi:putative acyl-CoA dehydrogenase
MCEAKGDPTMDHASGDAAATHEVLNQVGEPPDFNAYRQDQALSDAIKAFGAGWAAPKLAACGALIGSGAMRQWAYEANRYGPELRTHDRFGHRIDQVMFHPAWHELMTQARASETHALAWTSNQQAGQVAAHVARAGLAYLWGQGEPGVMCPSAMTFAAQGALAHAPDLRAQFGAKIWSTAYDPRPLPPAEKAGLVVAMAMTEKQGGSDLRQTQTTARPLGGGRYALTGHKWFFSVPIADLFLTLARTESGISCFLAQGWRDDGARNGVQIQRLKDKMGNRSNASSEVEFRDLEAVMVGAEGRGIATIIDMAHLTRLECAIGAAALMRQATSLALFHASRRTAFQRKLIDQPMMQAVLADMALDSEAALWLSLRAAAAIDQGEALARVIVPVAKYFICKRAPGLVAEAVECHGGNGFVEENPIARLYREAPLNGLWEGSGNVMCLDVIRALTRQPESAAALRAELVAATGLDPALDGLLGEIEAALAAPTHIEPQARRVVEQIALALSVAVLRAHAPEPLAGWFCAARIATPALAYGAARGIDAGAMLARAAVIRAA